MKTVLSLSFALVTSTLLAGDGMHYLSKENFAPLGVSAPVVRLNIGYPGPRLSQVCGVVVRVSDGFGIEDAVKKLATELEVNEGFNDRLENMPIKVSEGHLVAQLPARFMKHQTYMALVNVRTRSGQPLAKVISGVLGEGHTAIALPLICK